MKLEDIIIASRLRTLPLAMSSIITGNAIAYYFGAFNWPIFILSILTTVSLQLLSNYSNDLGDSEKGADNDDRIGPKRTIQSGRISTSEMKRIIKISILSSLLFGIGLIVISNLLWWEKLGLFIIGIASIWAANNYTRGNLAYGYRALGDVFVFLFFGLVGVLGSLFLNIHSLNNAALLPAIGVGFLCTSVLHLNNLRDMHTDKIANKLTFAIKLGYENSKLYFLFLILGAILIWGSYVFTQNITNYFSFLYWIGFIPFLGILIRFFKIEHHAAYDQLLKPTAISTFILSILFFISQIL